jgi:exoribonuclease-2
LSRQIDVKELWEVLGPEEQWIDLETMAGFCFPGEPDDDRQAAVIRAFFRDRLYFRFQTDRFFPNSEEQVEQRIARKKEEEHRERIVEAGTRWLKALTGNGRVPAMDEDPGLAREFADILRSFYLYEKESPHAAVARILMSRVGLNDAAGLFPVLVRMGVFQEHENCDLHRLDVPVAFPPAAREKADRLARSCPSMEGLPGRRDLTHLPALTIDGQTTLDFDDALSLESDGGCHRVGIHIADVGHFIRKGDDLDAAAAQRGSSIYMPDDRIPMLPPELAEGLCSLKAGRVRPAISVMITLGPRAEVIGSEVFASLIRVRRQLSYYDVNLIADQDRDMVVMRDIASCFRKARLEAGAVHISLPEVHIWIGEDGQVCVSRVNRESPGRMLVAELMILANWMMARFLAEQGLPAVFRSQSEPRERLEAGERGTLFQNYMQRRLLNRFVLGTGPQPHSGLGLNAYVTATSPIRKYVDLVTQRQVRAALGLEPPYGAEEMEDLIQRLQPPMSRVVRMQRNRSRYWLLRYLEERTGQREEAVVLFRKRSSYQVLLTEYVLECEIPAGQGLDLQPGDTLQVTLQRVDARRGVLAAFAG